MYRSIDVSGTGSACYQSASNEEMAARGYFQTRIPRERNLTTSVPVFDTVGCLAERSPFRLKTGPFCFQAKMADETKGKK